MIIRVLSDDYYNKFNKNPAIIKDIIADEVK